MRKARLGHHGAGGDRICARGGALVARAPRENDGAYATAAFHNAGAGTGLVVVCNEIVHRCRSTHT